MNRCYWTNTTSKDKWQRKVYLISTCTLQMNWWIKLLWSSWHTHTQNYNVTCNGPLSHKQAVIHSKPTKSDYHTDQCNIILLLQSTKYIRTASNALVCCKSTKAEHVFPQSQDKRSHIRPVDWRYWTDWKWMTMSETRVVCNITSSSQPQRFSQRLMCDLWNTPSEAVEGKKTCLQRVFCICWQHSQMFCFKQSSQLTSNISTFLSLHRKKLKDVH